jgi:hypothetical protein
VDDLSSRSKGDRRDKDEPVASSKIKGAYMSSLADCRSNVHAPGVTGESDLRPEPSTDIKGDCVEQ